MNEIKPNEIDLLTVLKRSHDKISRLISTSLMILLLLMAALFWWLGISYSGHEQALGATLLVAAAIIHLSPVISFYIIRFLYRRHENAQSILSAGWKAFKQFPSG